jgi:hypothetical protein
LTHPLFCENEFFLARSHDKSISSKTYQWQYAYQGSVKLRWQYTYRGFVKLRWQYAYRGFSVKYAAYLELWSLISILSSQLETSLISMLLSQLDTSLISILSSQHFRGVPNACLSKHRCQKRSDWMFTINHPIAVNITNKCGLHNK